MHTRDCSVRFINHASVQVIQGQTNLLVDPWYFGSVFNGSWKLLREGNFGLRPGITHLCFSHEHPDHLNFPTVRLLLDQGWLSQDCVVLFPERPDQSIRRAFLKMGLKTMYVPNGRQEAVQTLDGLEISFYGEDPEGDHSIVISCGSGVILDQNDHYPNYDTCNAILSDFGRPDVLLTQFSLAGYYGNASDPASIQEFGHDFHLARMEMYAEVFRPTQVVPFASFVWFSATENQYLNDFIVKPSEVLKLSTPETPVRFIRYGSEIFAADYAESEMTQSEIAAEYDLLFASLKDSPDTAPAVDQEALLVNWIGALSLLSVGDRLKISLLSPPSCPVARVPGIDKFIKDGESKFKRRVGKFQRILQRIQSLRFPKLSLKVRLMDYEDVDLILHLFPRSCAEFVELQGTADVYAPSAHWAFIPKYAFGPDTFNIAATHEIFDGRVTTLLSCLGRRQAHLRPA